MPKLLANSLEDSDTPRRLLPARFHHPRAPQIAARMFLVRKDAGHKGFRPCSSMHLAPQRLYNLPNHATQIELILGVFFMFLGGLSALLLLLIPRFIR